MRYTFPMLAAFPLYVIITDGISLAALSAAAILGGVFVHGWFTYMPRPVAIIATVVYTLGCVAILTLLFSAQNTIV